MCGFMRRQEDNEFERDQVSRAFLQDTVRAYFVRPLKVAELILFKTSHSPPKRLPNPSFLF